MANASNTGSGSGNRAHGKWGKEKPQYSPYNAPSCGGTRQEGYEDSAGYFTGKYNPLGNNVLPGTSQTFNKRRLMSYKSYNMKTTKPYVKYSVNSECCIR